jgi:hypothetical protein
MAMPMMTSSAKAFRSRSTCCGCPAWAAVSQRRRNRSVMADSVGWKRLMTSGVKACMTSLRWRRHSSPSAENTPRAAASSRMLATRRERRHWSGRSCRICAMSLCRLVIRKRRSIMRKR